MATDILANWRKMSIYYIARYVNQWIPQGDLDNDKECNFLLWLDILPIHPQWGGWVELSLVPQGKLVKATFK